MYFSFARFITNQHCLKSFWPEFNFKLQHIHSFSMTRTDLQTFFSRTIQRTIQQNSRPCFSQDQAGVQKNIPKLQWRSDNLQGISNNNHLNLVSPNQFSEIKSVFLTCINGHYSLISKFIWNVLFMKQFY